MKQDEFISKVFEICYNDKDDYMTCKCHKKHRIKLRELYIKLKEQSK